MYLAISPEQGFYSAKASIGVAPLQKLDAVSHHKENAAVLLGDSARPDSWGGESDLGPEPLPRLDCLCHKGVERMEQRRPVAAIRRVVQRQLVEAVHGAEWRERLNSLA